MNTVEVHMNSHSSFIAEVNFPTTYYVVLSKPGHTITLISYTYVCDPNK
jgi:hypothetical protein